MRFFSIAEAQPIVDVYFVTVSETVVGAIWQTLTRRVRQLLFNPVARERTACEDESRPNHGPPSSQTHN